MTKTTLLLTRLDQIGQSLAQQPQALALIGLGSVGAELARLDEYSDLDFFVIVQPAAKAHFLADLAWLSAPRPLVYSFRNTVDGYKALFDDDVFCEFAIFEPAELAQIPFAPGRIVWKRPDVDPTIWQPAHPLPPPSASDPAWLVGEALTNLYVGLSRYHRGEKLSAARFIQGYAVDRLIALSSQLEPEQPGFVDPFVAERRYEQRYPQLAHQLAAFMQGYEQTPASAAALLDFLEGHFAVNAPLAARIRQLIQLAHDSAKG